ncbi:Nucleotide-binding universal stress protein, UspA family [Algoriphagus faecimaris]|uniref:Nucleotide-binding universal stress protein, UspA family n=1 Tax=Algoriphagus faecimaris TaxID=686796 RepID=A0A1G6RYW0_9BACT|nr:universal stress protein [Algoriphagus faecimaris]SDD09613.1 Nucleotide-binding universal stress protein, UspA family [Algoriphagus faecimaris]
MKTIVIPFDFSPYSLAALKTAQKVSVKSGAKIICVTVIPSEVDYDKLSDEAKLKYTELREEKEEAERILPDYIHEVAPAKADIVQEVRIGVPNELILRVAEEFSADLIVMGAYGKGYSQGKFIGSTLQKVLRKSTVPVLAVKEALDGNDFRKIAFASTFHPDSKQAFAKIKSLVKAFKSSVHLLFVNTPDKFTSSDEVKKGMDLFQSGNEEIVFHQHTYNDGEVEKGILGFCQESGIKWLAVVTGKHDKSPTYQISTTETILFKGDLGILSVKV